MNDWGWDNPRAFEDQVDCSNPQKTILGKVKHTSERFSWYGSDNLSTMIELPCWRQYKPGDFRAVKPLNSDQIIDEDDDENRADPGAPSGGRSCPSDGNDNDNGQGEEDTQGGEKGTRKGKGTKNVKGKGKGKATEDVKAKGNGIGTVLLNNPQEEMISLVALLCSCRRECVRQTWTWRANQSRYIQSQKHRQQCRFPQMMIPTLRRS